MKKEEKKWIKWMCLGGGGGFFVGAIIKCILNLALKSSAFDIIKVLMIPACIIIGLLIVLYFYQREKDNIL